MKDTIIRSQQLSLSPRANFSWNFVGKVAYAAARAFLLILIAKLGTAEMVGQYSLAFAITSPVFMMTDLDLRSVLVTDAHNQYKFGHYLGLRTLVTLFSLLVVGVLAIAQHNWQVGWCILLVGAAKSFEAVSDILYGLMQRQERLDKLGLSLIMKSILSVLLMGVLVWQQHSIVAGAAGVAIAYLVVLVLYDFPVIRPYASVRILPDAKVFWKLTLVSLPLGIVLLFVSLNKNISNYFINAYLGNDALGYYASMIYIMSTGSLCVSALGQANNARLARLFGQGDKKGFGKIVQKMTMATLFMGLCMLLGSALFGRQILTLLYQPEYAQYQNIFLLIMAASGISYTAEISQVAIIATRNFKVQPYAYGGVLLAGLLLNFILVPTWGLAGAAWCLLATSFLQFAINLVVLGVILHKKNGRIVSTDVPINDDIQISIHQISFPPDEELITGWKDILSSRRCDTACADPDWLLAWWETFGAGQEPLLLAAYDEEKLVGVFPLMITRKRFARECCFMGEPQATRMDLAVLDGYMDRVVPALWANLRQLKGPILFHFSGMTQGANDLNAVMNRVAESGSLHLVSSVPSPMLTCDAQKYEIYYRSRFSSHAVKNNRRDEKRLAQLGAVSVRELTAEDMPQAFRLHEERWKKKLDTSGFCDEQSRAFFTRLMTLPRDRFRALALGLYLDNRLVAFQYGFICEGRACLYKSAHDDLLGIYAPGKMMKREFVRRCFEQGLRVVDFGIGYEDYKAEWTDDQECAQSVLWAGNDILSRLLFLLPYLKGVLRDNLKKSRKIVLLKRNGLGKLRYLLSPQSIGGFLRSVFSVIEQQGFRPLLWSRLHLGREIKLECSAALQDQTWDIGEFSLATISDISELTLLMDLPAEELIRRIYRQDKCFIIRHDGKLLSAAWVKSKENREIYDLHCKRECAGREVELLLHSILGRLQEGAMATLTLYRQDIAARRAAEAVGFHKAEPLESTDQGMNRMERGITDAASNH